MKSDRKIVLASRSPRRKKLLEQIGLNFAVRESEYEEDMSVTDDPEELVKFLAMKKAISSLKNKPDFLIVDGSIKMPNCSTPQQPFVKGDQRIFTIAAASIIAKVTRDRIMREMDKQYPGYGFVKHKGYGTKLHQNCLDKFGSCPIHRKSFSFK